MKEGEMKNINKYEVIIIISLLVCGCGIKEKKHLQIARKSLENKNYEIAKEHSKIVLENNPASTEAKEIFQMCLDVEILNQYPPFIEKYRNILNSFFHTQENVEATKEEYYGMIKEMHDLSTTLKHEILGIEIPKTSEFRKINEGLVEVIEKQIEIFKKIESIVLLNIQYEMAANKTTSYNYMTNTDRIMEIREKAVKEISEISGILEQHYNRVEEFKKTINKYLNMQLSYDKSQKYIKENMMTENLSDEKIFKYKILLALMFAKESMLSTYNHDSDIFKEKLGIAFDPSIRFEHNFRVILDGIIERLNTSNEAYWRLVRCVGERGAEDIKYIADNYSKLDEVLDEVESIVKAVSNEK